MVTTRRGSAAASPVPSTQYPVPSTQYLASTAPPTHRHPIQQARHSPILAMRRAARRISAIPVRRFSFDSANRVSYCNEQTSEERFYMVNMHDFMSDLSVRGSTTATS